MSEKNIVLDGKTVADTICKALKNRADVLKEKGVKPKLIIVTSGDNDASAVYVRNKHRRCEEIGVECITEHVPVITEKFVREIGKRLTPVIFQMPMESEVNIQTIGLHIDDYVDVDGFLTPNNIATLAAYKQPYNLPCTPAGIISLLRCYHIPIEGSSVCIVGRSNIVGRPLARLMEHRNATVTLCHSKTPREILINAFKAADIIVSATGQRNILTLDMVNDHSIDLSGKVLVDVGMNRNEAGKLCGDFDPEIFPLCKAYTPVPGGIGPMTVATLMENVINHYEREAANGSSQYK